MSVKIVSDVPMPEGWSISARYPFEKMAPGDSFEIDGGRAISAAWAFSRKHPDWKFATRKMPNGKRRIWRIA